MRYLIQVLVAIAATAAGPANAGIPVFDGANFANAVQQVHAWAEQYKQMLDQIKTLEAQRKQAEATFNALNGARGMGDLVNNPAMRRYLPNDWNQTLSLINNPGSYGSLSNSISAIRDAARIVNIEETGLSTSSPPGRAFVAAQDQAATNRAVSEAGYTQASERIGAIQTLLDNVNAAPDQKDILDLQARIQAESVMVQNEQVKLQALAQLQNAQRDIAAQQAREIGMKSTRGATGVPRF